MDKNKNLTHTLTVEEVRKGGIKSGESRREKANLRKALEALLEKDIKDVHGETMSGAEAMAVKLFQKALKGDVRAFEVLRDTAGQKPAEKVEMGMIEQSVIDEVEELVNDKKASS